MKMVLLKMVLMNCRLKKVLMNCRLKMKIEGVEDEEPMMMMIIDMAVVAFDRNR
ncbi:hypothetical protein HanHA300_Chr16g0605731 [Helianthus annuus]|nr:hypothetical protein HanHA300_Chr16g0605731 [Helianthus annuus]KAJ0442287.1 hypothetical protein HanIR_Chr16g0807431 [Helianthus annuus]